MDKWRSNLVRAISILFILFGIWLILASVASISRGDYNGEGPPGILMLIFSIPFPIAAILMLCFKEIGRKITLVINILNSLIGLFLGSYGIIGYFTWARYEKDPIFISVAKNDFMLAMPIVAFAILNIAYFIFLTRPKTRQLFS